jgi:hypothetical protein
MIRLAIFLVLTLILAGRAIATPEEKIVDGVTYLFRSLGCEDALFLDGDISQMRSGEDVTKPSNNFGSIIAVTETGNSHPTRKTTTD